MTTKGITYSAVAVAISTLAMVIAYFNPIGMYSPIILAILCNYLVGYKFGIKYILLTILASNLLVFAFTGFSSIIIVSLVFGIPYSLLLYYMRKITFPSKLVAVRIVCVFVIAVAAMLLISQFALVVIADFDVLTSVWWGILILAAAFGVIMIGLDFLLVRATPRLIKIIFRN